MRKRRRTTVSGNYAAMPQVIRPMPPAPSLEPPPRQRGRVMTHDWFTICGEIVRRCINPKTRHLALPKSESKLADAILQWLSDNNLPQPATSEMREAVRRVLAPLRQ